MKVCESWLREWVNPALSTQELASQLTMAGLEVDSIHPVAGEFSHVVVADVVSATPHPQADKLTICEIDAKDSKPYTVVCGAANVRVGLKVAFAKLGAVLPGGMEIKEVTLRGQLSQGMLCSASELGLEDSSEGILELPFDAPVGQDIRDYMILNDAVLDIDLTPNRADCFSVLGVAREVAAQNNLALKAVPSIDIKPQVDTSINIDVQVPAACAQYYGRVIRNINLDATSPLWLTERLRRGGIRPLHPVVDVVNYVMLELGQPMHAFDLNQLEDRDIIIRYANTNETLKLLDGQELSLAENVIVIADKAKPLAMAGIMGGDASAVQVDTSDIFLESAYFNPVGIAGVARQYGLCTDSSQRFERGVDPLMQRTALERATELLQQIAGGQAGPVSAFCDEKHRPARIEVSFNPGRVEQMTGVKIPVEKMETILTMLGMIVTPKQDIWRVLIPSHRFDIALEVDLIEEVIRLNGYDNIPSQPIATNARAGVTNRQVQLFQKAADFLCHRGYHETINYSFVDPDLQSVIYPEIKTLQLLNPISHELSHMRAGMWPGLIAAMIYNLHRQQSAIKLFETGVVFQLNNQNELVEQTALSGLIVGEQGQLNWAEPNRVLDFFDLKGCLEALFNQLHIQQVDFVAKAHPALHPGKSAQISIGQNPVGWIGVLHPRIADELDIDNDVVLFEFALAQSDARQPARYSAISKYPKIRRDLSLLADINLNVSDVEQVVRDVVDERWLKGFDVFDVYNGKGVPVGKKSIAVALTLQDDNRTLVDSEINTLIDAILKVLENKFAILLRD